MWEEINRLYLFLRSDAGARRAGALEPGRFFQRGQERLPAAHRASTDATVMHNEGWLFIQVGSYLERADKTSRILDVRHASFPDARRCRAARPSQAGALEWAAVLRSCSAWDAYKSIHGADGPPACARWRSCCSHEDFPRSVRFCAEELNTALRRISGVPAGRFANAAEQRSGRLLAELRFATVEDLLETHGLHGCLDWVQRRLAAIAEAVCDAYAGTSDEPEPPPLDQQMQQQQLGTPKPL